MNNIDIEQLLRENKPVVKDDPTFMPEVQQRLNAVDGIKKEIDRQRRHGHRVLLVTLIIGALVGILASLSFMLFPMDSVKGQLAGIMTLLAPWKPYLAIAAAIAVAVISIFLGDLYSWSAWARRYSSASMFHRP